MRGVRTRMRRLQVRLTFDAERSLLEPGRRDVVESHDLQHKQLYLGGFFRGRHLIRYYCEAPMLQVASPSRRCPFRNLQLTMLDSPAFYKNSNPVSRQPERCRCQVSSRGPMRLGLDDAIRGPSARALELPGTAARQSPLSDLR